MTPLTVTAHLGSPASFDRPLMFDTILYAGLGRMRGAEHPSGRSDDVWGEDIPLARVETEHGWWWAASQVTPEGDERQYHLNRAPDYEGNARWTNRGSLNHASGPDKRLRIPYYYRPGMLALTWTAFGDADAVGRLLAHVGGVGRQRTHGWGWVRRWEITREGPGLDAYRSAAVRHVPTAFEPPVGLDLQARRMPLRPPYYRRREGVPCWQRVR